MSHFLQSEAWQRFQQVLGHKTFRAKGDGWEYLAILEPAPLGLSRLYCPYGPQVNSSRALTEALKSLETLGNKLGVAYFRLQPVGITVTASKQLRPVTYSQPTHSWCIDLTQSETALLADMKQNNRNIYRNYRKKDLVHEVSHDPKAISRLTSLLHGVAAHNHITIHSDAYFRAQADTLLQCGDAELHFITKDGETLAAALVYLDKTTAYYAHAAASFEQRKLGASTALVAEIIMDAKRKGKQYCDLYGVTTSNDPQHKWAGFTKFKQSFGGYLISYNATYEHPLRPQRYRALQAARTIRKRLL